MLFFNNSEAQIPVLSETQLDHDCFFISFKRITDMAFRFTPEDFEKIAQALGVSARTEGNMTRFELKDADTGRKLALEIHPDIQVPDADAMSLVSVYAANSFLQLQSCTGYVASEDLGEVIFFAKQNGGAAAAATAPVHEGMTHEAPAHEAPAAEAPAHQAPGVH